MSEKNRARRATAEVAFNGIDITKSIQPYLLSLTYTDNEEDESDDLQIELQDRNGNWLKSWLAAALDIAAETETAAAASASSGGSVYTVTAKSGLRVRSGPGTGYSRITTLPYGTEVTVTGADGAWSIVEYNGTTGYMYSAYLTAADGSSDETDADSTDSATSKLKTSAVILRENWNGDGSDEMLDCGQFELDSMSSSGPPATVTLKATALPYSATIRQTLKTRGWESYYLSGIAKEMATNSGMTCMYESATDPYYERVEQYKTSDINFLSTLCKNAGISLKATNNILVLFDQATYEATDAVKTFTFGDGSYEKWKLDTGSADTEYSSCRVSYTSDTGKTYEGIAYVEDYDEDADTNQQLEVTARVSSNAEAKALAEKRLRLHNKFERTLSLTVPGDPALVAGVTIQLSGWGLWNGKYLIYQAVHSLDNGGYTTKINARQVLENY